MKAAQALAWVYILNRIRPEGAADYVRQRCEIPRRNVSRSTLSMLSKLLGPELSFAERRVRNLSGILSPLQGDPTILRFPGLKPWAEIGVGTK